MSQATYLKTGVFVDSEYVHANGGLLMRYDVLRQFACLDGSFAAALNTYLPNPHKHADQDTPEALKQNLNYQKMIRNCGWNVTVGKPETMLDEPGSSEQRQVMQLTVDALSMVDQLDRVILVLGQSKYIPLVKALRSRGCRVELIGFKNVSNALLQEVDIFYSGFLQPGLLPISYEPRNDWGHSGSCVRGICNKWFPDKGYGFVRVIGRLALDTWNLDPRATDSPYISVFCHVNEVADEVNEDMLTDQETILEFYMMESEQKENGWIANNVRLAFNQS